MARFDAVKLQSLLEVDRRGSISGAARALHLTPSAVSQHLSALEAAAGAELLQRSATGTRLTPLGRTIARHAASIEGALEAIVQDLARPDTASELRIGFVPSVAAVLARAIADHSETWPECSVHGIETAPEDAARDVLLGDLDAAVTVEWPHHPSRRSPELRAALLLVEPLLIAHPSPAPRRSTGLRRFERSTWVAAGVETGCGTALRIRCREAGFEPDVRHQTNDFAAAVALAAATGSATVVPSVLGPPLPDDITTFAVPGLARHLVLISRHVVAPAVETLERNLTRRLTELATATGR